MKPISLIQAPFNTRRGIELANSLSRFMDEESLRKLKALKNITVEEQVTRFLELCKPAKATVITDSP
jgi:hypothetical protein